MKKKRIFRNLIFFGGVSAFLLFPLTNYGQSVKRQSISSYGASGNVAGAFISQTGGQSYATTNLNQEKGMVLQGFQQYNNFALKIEGPLNRENLDMEIYPNPATQAFIISSKKAMENYTITIADSWGKIVLSEYINDIMRYQVNCESYSNGIYFITVKNSNYNTQTLKLIISK